MEHGWNKWGDIWADGLGIFFRPEIATSGVQNAIDVLIWPCEVLEAHLYFPPEKPSWMTGPNMKYNVQPSFTNVEPIWGGFNHLWPIWQFWAKIGHFWGPPGTFSLGQKGPKWPPRIWNTMFNPVWSMFNSFEAAGTTYGQYATLKLPYWQYGNFRPTLVVFGALVIWGWST